jgi:hypothetical protein
VFALLCSTGFVLGRGVSLLPVAEEAAQLGNGRFAIYDPAVTHLGDLIRVGEPDLNALTRRPSVQGYGSIVARAYDDATGTHLDGTLSPCALEGGTLTALGLRTILALPGSVAPGVAQGPSAAPVPPACGIGWPSEQATSRRFLLERPSLIDRVDLVFAGALVPTDLAGLRVGVVAADQSVTWPPASARSAGPGRLSVRFESVADAVGVVVSGHGSGQVSDASVVIGPSVRVALDGPLQDALDRGGWSYAGTVSGFSKYVLDRPVRWVWIDGDVPGATATRSSISLEGTETDLVSSSRPVVVERNEAFASGWHAEAVSTSTGKSFALRVRAVGLVQGVSLPAGSYRVVWSYWAPGLTTGLALSLAGLIFAVGGVLITFRPARGRACRRPSRTGISPRRSRRTSPLPRRPGRR